MRTDEGLLGFGVQLSTAGTKMLVSNLGPEVTDEDLEELFQEHGGPIKKAEIFYKQDGTSSGQGEVIFKRRADADKVPSASCGLCSCQSVPPFVCLAVSAAERARSFCTHFGYLLVMADRLSMRGCRECTRLDVAAISSGTRCGACRSCRYCMSFSGVNQRRRVVVDLY
jgi:hypothetical protein